MTTRSAIPESTRCLRARPARYAPHVENRRGGVSVLLVEDEYIIRDAMRPSCGLAALTSLQQPVPANALKFLERHNVDLLVSDIQMPERDGFWLIRAVRSRPALRSLPAIAFTSLERDDTQRILDAGFSAHVGKANPHTLWLTIQSLRPRLAR